MAANLAQQIGWKVRMADPPKLNRTQWQLSSLAGVVLIVMALLQLASFTDFKSSLTAMGLKGATAWGIVIVLVELWAAAGFFALRLSYFFRMVSAGLAILVSGFWFIENLQLVSSGSSISTSDFFGRFLRQAPGWWSIVEASLFLFWVIFVLGLAKDAAPQTKRK